MDGLSEDQAVMHEEVDSTATPCPGRTPRQADTAREDETKALALPCREQPWNASRAESGPHRRPTPAGHPSPTNKTLGQSELGGEQERDGEFATPPAHH